MAAPGVRQRLLVLNLIFAFLTAIRVFFRSRGNTFLEVLALRQQVTVLKRKRPRPALNGAPTPSLRPWSIAFTFPAMTACPPSDTWMLNDYGLFPARS